MKETIFQNKKIWIGSLFIIMVLQLVVASYFCMQKQGFHYDEYYSYYSTNSTYGLVPTDREWKDGEEIRNEFVVLEGEGFQYGKVRLMQTYDVHPPLYYFILHTLCSFFQGVFSKWFGLALNLFLFAIAYLLFARISYEIFHGDRVLTLLACLPFGFQPGVLSGITFIRMYMLLLVWCLALTCWHIPLWQGEIKLSPKRAVSLLLLVIMGFLTHYYFAVFLFFTAAYTCLYHWWGKKNLKGSVSYGFTVCMGMVIAVLLYPASLSHIFRGYRGTEATEAFFDLSNTLQRLNFFTGLMNDSVFGGAFWVLTIFLLWLVFSLLFACKKNGKSPERGFFHREQGLFFLTTVTLGYFVVVAKTALLNAEEANRYELPIYGFCLLIMLALIYHLEHEKVRVTAGEEQEKRKANIVGFVFSVVGLILSFQILDLKGDGVQFLYPDDRANVEWAKENRDATVVYLYNPNNQWMIWDESEELMQYDEIYFVSLADPSAITDEKILDAEQVYVYSSRMDEGERIIQELIRDNAGLEQSQKIRELLYCDLYLLE